MTVELVCACVGAEEEVDPAEESGIFAMYVQVCSAICVHNSVWLDIVDNNITDNCLHLLNWRWQSLCWFDWVQVGELEDRRVVLWVVEGLHGCRKLD